MSARREGSLMQFYLSDEAPAFSPQRTDGEAANLFHLASLNHGVFASARGTVALSTAIDDAVADDAADRLTAALDDLADVL